MTRFSTRVLGPALAFGALALTPVVAFADVVIKLPEEYTGSPCVIAGVIQEYPDEYVDRPSATVLILSDCAREDSTPLDEPNNPATYAGQRVIDPQLLERVTWAYSGRDEVAPTEPSAGYAGDAGGQQLTRERIEFLEDNIWELQGLAQLAGVEGGYRHHIPDVIGLRPY